ncbi:hypothetical protein, partial [Nostoc sp.]|uniref:hypothetical protein n=1 Tax=Nostoc sp. TaxID=1180 RepID=UPI002FF81FEE
ARNDCLLRSAPQTAIHPHRIDGWGFPRILIIFRFSFQQPIRHDKISKKASVIFLVSKNVTISAFDYGSVKVRTYKSYLAIALEL